MATIAIDPLIVAKINVLLASSFGKDGGAGFTTADIIELFDSLFLDARVYHELSPSCAQMPSSVLEPSEQNQ